MVEETSHVVGLITLIAQVGQSGDILQRLYCGRTAQIDNTVSIFPGQKVGLSVDTGVHLAAYCSGIAVGGAAGIGDRGGLQSLTHQERSEGQMAVAAVAYVGVGKLARVVLDVLNHILRIGHRIGVSHDQVHGLAGGAGYGSQVIVGVCSIAAEGLVDHGSGQSVQNGIAVGLIVIQILGSTNGPRAALGVDNHQGGSQGVLQIGLHKTDLVIGSGACLKRDHHSDRLGESELAVSG